MAADPVSVRRLKVFLCHAREDKPAVRLLHKRLAGDGYQPWLDEEDILGGQDWRHAIKDAVQTSDLVLVCLSMHSIHKEGFVQAEIGQALDLAREKPEETFFVIPARLEECPVPKRLEDKQWIDLHAPNGYDKLKRSLVAWLSPPRPGDRPAVIAPYEIRVDPFAAQRVATWRAEYEAQRDPDNAISIPVPIVPAKPR